VGHDILLTKAKNYANERYFIDLSKGSAAWQYCAQWSGKKAKREKKKA
jgi:hypothetical protein